MLQVSWRFVLLTASQFAGHRVKRRLLAGSALQELPGGSVPAPGTLAWTGVAPPHIQLQPPGETGTGYVFAFWSFRYLLGKPDPALLVEGFPIVTLSSQAAPAPELEPTSIVEATAWYVWDQGAGPGQHGILIDAFDMDSGDWMAEDFVQVHPDDGTLTAAANDGFMPTGGLAPPPASATITALDLNTAHVQRTFSRWNEVAALSAAGSAAGKPTVGQWPSPRDIVAHSNDIAMGIAFYSSTVTIERPRDVMLNPWWKLWVLRPPPTEDPRFARWVSGFQTVIAAQGLSLEGRRKALELALRELSADLGSQSRTTSQRRKASRGKGK